MPGGVNAAPAGCVIGGGTISAARSGAPSKVNINYEGFTFGPACTATGLTSAFRIGINLWTETGTHWAFTSTVIIIHFTVNADGYAFLPPGQVTIPCKHLANVKAKVNYVSAATTTYWTKVTHCS
jgi:hypothetical protein